MGAQPAAGHLPASGGWTGAATAAGKRAHAVLCLPMHVRACCCPLPPSSRRLQRATCTGQVLSSLGCPPARCACHLWARPCLATAGIGYPRPLFQGDEGVLELELLKSDTYDNVSTALAAKLGLDHPLKLRLTGGCPACPAAGCCGGCCANW